MQIKKMRKRSGLSQKNFAQKISVSQQAVAKWENGKSCPSAARLRLIAQVLNCTIDDLCREDGA